MSRSKERKRRFRFSSQTAARYRISPIAESEPRSLSDIFCYLFNTIAVLDRFGNLMSSSSSADATEGEAPRIIVVGLGGATCSGKTTLAKHLLRILNEPPSDSCIHEAFILHQDDFAPPEASLPVDDQYGVTDWDRPDTAIEYDRMYRTLSHIKQTGRFPPEFSSHDHLNSQPDCPIASSVFEQWRNKFGALKATPRSMQGVRIMLADGFLLYYDPAVCGSMDVKIFLRTPRAVLKQRREQRFGYATAEGTVWKDPPGYFDNIVWPAYQAAHQRVFQNGDLEQGDMARLSDEEQPTAGGPVSDLIVLDAQSPGTDASYSQEMSWLVDHTCEAIWRYLQ